ncbi:Phosphoenolpyruvate/pyruvate domain-containing protein [Teratosphaeria nubilosa]|uniref:Phosphoenolpyruvate/pyruvate domain-containing protein n=1 Tax=Teratosphaeria nubilosa TaxID=161662 RepID=A0A6G1KTZ6_9PEZI|nr:Phosphoenolpyruvate/pyruvate domain-containing protein [Teratosphaeria nubilosa]
MDLAAGKKRLRASFERAASGGDPSVGQWLEFPGFTLARTVASLGCDWVLIECEHGNIDDSAMYHAVAAIASAGASPVVRVAGSENWMIKRALDAGAHGIMVPMVETAEQAQAVARFAHYPKPHSAVTGTRGCGGIFANASFGLTAPEYLRQANESITVIVQIESPVGVDNCAEIAAVHGIDALFIGPNDLASSMGYFAFDHPKIPEVQEAAAKVLKAAREKGKYAGHFALGAEEAAKRLRQGWHFVNCGADVVALTTWMTSEMAKLKELRAQAA